jgi:hypothetical protein
VDESQRHLHPLRKQAPSAAAHQRVDEERYSSIRSAAISDAISTPLPTIPGFSGLGRRPAVEL